MRSTGLHQMSTTYREQKNDMRFHQMMQFQAQQTNAMLKMMAMGMNPAITPEQLSVFEVKAPRSSHLRNSGDSHFSGSATCFYFQCTAICTFSGCAKFSVFWSSTSHVSSSATCTFSLTCTCTGQGPNNSTTLYRQMSLSCMQRTRIIWYYRREENVLRCPQG